MPKAELDTGVDLYFEVTGEGPPVLLIPASSLASEVWHPHPADDLSTEFSIITFDPRGLGRSPARDEFISVEQMAADAAALLRFLEIPSAHVLGHSMGGRVALSMTLTFPRLVRSLVMAASGSGAAIRSGESIMPMPTPKSIMGIVADGFDEHVRRDVWESDNWFPAEFRKQHPEVVQQFWERMWLGHADLNWHLRLQMARARFDVTHRLQDVQAPTLVLVGAADVAGARPHTPASELLAERIPDSELRTLPGLAHGLFWQEPQVLAEVLAQWFRKH